MICDLPFVSFFAIDGSRACCHCEKIACDDGIMVPWNLTVYFVVEL